MHSPTPVVVVLVIRFLVSFVCGEEGGVVGRVCLATPQGQQTGFPWTT
jgi:hypothetical protein